MSATVYAACLLLGVADRSTQSTPSEATITIGQVIIVGNTHASRDDILRATGLVTGGKISMTELRLAEKALMRLGIFDVNPELGIRPTITIIQHTRSGPNDLLIRVKQSPVELLAPWRAGVGIRF